MSIINGAVTDKYAFDKEIGFGSYGKVYSLKPTADGRVLCCKKIVYSDMSRKAKQLIRAEIDITMKLYHENIVRYHEIFEDITENSYGIVMDYYTNGDMLAFLRQHRIKKMKIEEDLLWAVLVQILMALEYCHSPFNATGKAIIHRDIKPANLLIGDDMQIKLADFGVCRLYENSHENTAMTIVGTPVYMPPEIFTTGTYTTAFDIWSLGCTMYELAAQRFLITGATDRDRLERAKEVTRRPLTIPGYSTEFVAVVSSMVRFDADERPTAADLLRSPIIQDVRNRWASSGKYGYIGAGNSAGIAANAVAMSLFNLDPVCCVDPKADEIEFFPPEGEDAKPEMASVQLPPAIAANVDDSIIKAELKQLPAGDPNDMVFKGTTPLMQAVKENNIEAVKQHLDAYGKKQRLDGMTALMLAALTNNVEAGRLLVETEKGMRSLSGFTALLYAIENKNTEFAKLMAPHEKHMSTSKITPRDAAARMSMGEVASML